MGLRLYLAFFTALAHAAPPFVDIQTVAPGIQVELRYATSDNFVGQQVYPQGSRAYLRKPVAESLAKVQQDLQKRGYGLKVWDAYRPFSIQEIFWAKVPKKNYVRRPVRRDGKMVDGSVHNRGGAVDLTLVDKDGKEVEMPTPFDDFTLKAHRKYMKAGAAAIRHRKILEGAMHRHGFKGIPTEWWHFDWEGSERFPLSDDPIASLNPEAKAEP